MKRTGVSIFIAVIMLSSVSWAKDESVGPLKLTAGYSNIWAENDHASDYLFDAAIKLNRYHLLTVGAERLSRVFVDGPLLTDERLAISDIYQLNKRLYWENNLTSAGAHPHFLPQVSAQTIPHFVLRGGSEIGLGLTYASYPGANVETISPSYLYPATDTLLFGATANAIWTKHALGSGFVFVQDKIGRRHTIRATVADGESIEGIGLEGHFHSYALNYKYRISRRWWIEPYGEVYRGSIRNQNTVGAFLQWCPL